MVSGEGYRRSVGLTAANPFASLHQIDHGRPWFALRLFPFHAFGVSLDPVWFDQFLEGYAKCCFYGCW